MNTTLNDLVTSSLAWNSAVIFLPFVFAGLFLMAAEWVGGEGLLSVNSADHHTASHMPASMIDSFSLSWAKWKKSMLRVRQRQARLPDKCV